MMLKFISFLILGTFVLPWGAYAGIKTDFCNGNDIATDYWGTKYGCRCKGGKDKGVSGYKDHNGTIISTNPGKVFRCSKNNANGIDSWDDQWFEENGGFCKGQENVTPAANARIEMDDAGKCWTYRCPNGSAFKIDSAGKVDYSQCVAINDLSKRVVDGVMYDIPCGGSEDKSPLTGGKNFGTEVIIYNGKCMPICAAQSAGVEYDTAGTHITIKLSKADKTSNTSNTSTFSLSDMPSVKVLSPRNRN